MLDIPRVCPTTHIHVSECDEEKLQRSPIDGDIRRTKPITKPNSSVATIQSFLNVLIEALRDQRRAARQQREIEECRRSSDAGGYCSCCRTDLLQEHLRRLLAELSEARACGRQANEGNGRAEPRKRARQQVVRQPKQWSARVHSGKTSLRCYSDGVGGTGGGEGTWDDAFAAQASRIQLKGGSRKPDGDARRLGVANAVYINRCLPLPASGQHA